MEDRFECRFHGCSRKVGTTCSVCGSYVCSKHSDGVADKRICHRCIKDLHEEMMDQKPRSKGEAFKKKLKKRRANDPQKR
jgi:hypothetical protein